MRRELAEWYGSPKGPDFYYQAIKMGRQAIKPPGSPEKAAVQLAATETKRLSEGDLWYVDDDLCALLNAAHPTMPKFAPQPWDLPGKVGFAVFAEPLYRPLSDDQTLTSDLEARAAADPDFAPIADRLLQDDSGILAVSWGPVSNPYWPAGGLWMSFYSEALAHQDAAFFEDPRQAAWARNQLPVLIVDNEATMAWQHDAAPVEEFQLPGPDEPVTTLSWARLVFAAFQLASQGNLSETDTVAPGRPERRRTDRAGLPAKDVRVVRLRRSVTDSRADDGAETSRQYRHRWVVRGHWRNHWYPARKTHRPTWIAPYLKGPETAPLLGGERVTVIDAPKQADES
ncbi:hypothetical protein [Stackebrandtia nassauensis]|uniref:hypothetical protein n=1 Tax=Stackebrandtia nassauensis TaxID=283811 RepID=UPI001185ABF5|nr:hypothetical protein [Stackebrandtia nassauensis]